MSDMPSVPDTVSTASAGQMLRAAREATGLHIVALAAALKVPVRKLEALEANRWEELTDATFVRALAGSVARHLKVDAAPILQALPAGKTAPIEVPDNLGRASGADVQFGMSSGIPKVTWAVLAFLFAALALYLLPDAVFKSLSGLGSTGPMTQATTTSQAVSTRPDSSDTTPVGQPSEGTSQGKGVVEQPEVSAKSIPPIGGEAIQGGAAPAEKSGVASVTPVTTQMPQAVGASNVSIATGSTSNTALTIKATADTWIEVTGQDGKLRAQRLLKQGDTAEFDDSPAFAVVLGNASGARVWVKGTAFDLTPVVKNNIARFDAR